MHSADIRNISGASLENTKRRHRHITNVLRKRPAKTEGRQIFTAAVAAVGVPGATRRQWDNALSGRMQYLRRMT